MTGNTTIHVHCHETRAKVILHARDMELTEGNIYKIIDIQYRDHTCFSCINICRVPRKLDEHEAVRPSVQTSHEGPGKC